MTADRAVNAKIAAEAPLNLRALAQTIQPADDWGDAADQVADHVTGAGPLGEVEQQPDAATDLDRRDKHVEAHPVLRLVGPSDLQRSAHAPLARRQPYPNPTRAGRAGNPARNAVLVTRCCPRRSSGASRLGDCPRRTPVEGFAQASGRDASQRPDRVALCIVA